MKVHGRCHCGAISYEAQVDPQTVSVCHCADCQILTGTAFRWSVPAKAADFHLTGGTPKIYVKIAESGNRRAQAFCADCGSPVYASAPENPPVYMLRAGIIAERAQLKPVRQIWCNAALGWLDDLSAVAKHDKA